MFAALGSGASIEYIQEKASACVEILWKVAHDMSGWTGSRDLNRRTMKSASVLMSQPCALT
jgi:hypothetical protein